MHHTYIQLSGNVELNPGPQAGPKGRKLLVFSYLYIRSYRHVVVKKEWILKTVDQDFFGYRSWFVKKGEQDRFRWKPCQQENREKNGKGKICVETVPWSEIFYLTLLCCQKGAVEGALNQAVGTGTSFYPDLDNVMGFLTKVFNLCSCSFRRPATRLNNEANPACENVQEESLLHQVHFSLPWFLSVHCQYLRRLHMVPGGHLFVP